VPVDKIALDANGTVDNAVAYHNRLLGATILLIIAPSQKYCGVVTSGVLVISGTNTMLTGVSDVLSHSPIT
jgi:hypothetical protein